ncbi:MAG: LacI family DNA-binding transcriptional regulator [Luteolibacter sp.]
MLKPTIRDIAKHCGLSPSAVSSALRNKRNISAATKDRVKLAAEELGYRTDAKLSQLMSYMRTSKGSSASPSLVLLHNTESPTFMDEKLWLSPYVQGIENRCAQFGYILEKMWFQAHKPERICSILKARGIEGVILFQPSESFPAGIQSNLNCFALCAIEGDHEGHRYQRVASMGLENIRLAMENAARLGYRRPGLVSGQWVHKVNDGLLRAGFVESQWDLEPSQRIAPLVIQNWHLELANWYRECRPDVIICGDSTTILHLNAAGIRVPEDVAIIHWNSGPDVSDWAGVDNLHRVVGSAAVDLLVAQIHRGETGLPIHPKSIFLNGIWRDGWTCPQV